MLSLTDSRRDTVAARSRAVASRPVTVRKIAALRPDTRRRSSPSREGEGGTGRASRASRRPLQRCSTLPSTLIAWPVMLAAPGEQRKRARAAMSSVLTIRRSEILDR